MTVIAHVSDIHFGRELPEAVEALLADLAMLRPDVVVVSGDMTQSASRREFAEARAFLDRMPAPVLVVPGNHDIVAFPLSERFFAPFRRWQHFIADGLSPEWSHAEVLIRGVNSARPFGPYLNWSRGIVSAAQLEALATAERDPRPLLVAAHHPVAYGNDTAQAYDLVTGGDRLLATLARRSKSVLLLGHRHRSHASVWNPAAGERPAVTGERLAVDDVVILHAGSATSDRLRGEVNAWNHLTLGEGGISVAVRRFIAGRWDEAERLVLGWPI
ncbi:metallophosphoesterase family protein [Phreatobacter oligotrophus]|jgi:3',5'-cyclic AMP phosphodiesterase CpdA|uniref:metallophosphoesterase family protein n=1 Tax=Phreatobacter oligotrophus TaxID=1122261 RepID=UPI002355DA2E|nr:metallophosphoesterase [Phreatobacter oligotrophus]MBX9988982.1 metallophosphoesterase [Phreatobacter oligotrophus]